jgi:hypothetical protein
MVTSLNASCARIIEPPAGTAISKATTVARKKLETPPKLGKILKRFIGLKGPDKNCPSIRGDESRRV